MDLAMFGYKSRVRWFCIVVVMIVLGALFRWPTDSQPLTSTATPAASPTPTDFSQVSEILGGRRLLFPEDDIIVTSGGGAAGAEVLDNVLQTKNNAISGVFPTDISGPSSFVVASGRMFNTPEDEVVTIGGGFVTLEATNFDTRFDNALGVPTQNVYAMADFTGDGLADLAFVTNNSEIEMITAADPNNLSAGFFYGSPIHFPAVPSGPVALAAGDFDGSGVNELAVVTVPNIAQVEVVFLKPVVTFNSNRIVTSFT